MTHNAPDTPDGIRLPAAYDISPQKADILGLKQAGPGYALNFFNRELILSDKRITASDGRDIPPAIREMVSAYLLNCPDTRPHTPETFVTFREFSSAAPLFSSFTANTAKTIQTHFSNKTDALALKCRELGALIHDSPSYDISVEFTALPRIRIFLNFNDRDEFMPATASFLYTDSATKFLSLKHLMTVATSLTGALIA